MTFRKQTQGTLLGAATLALLFSFGCRDREAEDEELEAQPEAPAASAIQTPVDDSPVREVSDQGITKAVANELLFDYIAPSGDVQISTSEGIVELTGEVDSLLAKRRVGQIAELVKGVRAVSNRVEVEAKAVPDVTLQADIKEALLLDPAAESYELEVSAEQGAVTLSGEVESWAEKRLAERVVASVPGVRSITNEVEIVYEGDRNDYDLQADIEARLEWDALVDERGIEVQVDDGVVTLAGHVGSAAERRRAEADAWTHGTKAVDASALAVAFGDEPNLRDRELVLETAEEIRAAILDAALHDPRVYSFKIDPKVEGSVVTLEGSVDNLEAKQAAGQLARRTVGVSEVVNQIRVDPVGVSDEEAEAKLRRGLLSNVYTEAFEIEVDVEAGVATLTGTVDSFLDKAEAGEVAAGTRGVSEVVNKLQVEDSSEGFFLSPYLAPEYPHVEFWATYAPASTALADEEIEAQIEEQLFWSPFVDEEEIEVSVHLGEATLRGSVDNWGELEAAAQNAFDGGAVSVDNQLEVEGS